MNWHWKTHIIMGLAIAFLWCAGWYLLGQVDGLKQAIAHQQQEYADLQTQATVVAVQTNSLADTTRKTVFDAEMTYARRIQERMTANLNKPPKQKKRSRKKKRHLKRAMGGGL